MAFECKIPELGENIESGTVASILVSVGDTVEKDQSLVELETEKAVLEVPAESSGTVKEIRIKEGEEVSVGQTIVVLDSQADTPEKEERTEPEPQPEKADPEKVAHEQAVESQETTAPQASQVEEGKLVEVKIPDLGENVTSGTVANVLVKPGDTIQVEQSIVELETEKAVVEVPSTASGTVKEIKIKSGDEVSVGQTLITVESAGEAVEREKMQKQPEVKAEKPAEPEKKEAPAPQPAAAPAPAAAAAPQAQAPSKDYKTPAAAAPSVRRFAREIGVDIHQVPGTGPGDRITIDDVKKYSKQQHEARPAPAEPGAVPAQVTLPDFSKWGEIERSPMNKVREKTAVHLSSAWATIPHVTQFDKADITELEKLRKQYGPKVEEAGGKLTMTAILLKVVAAALKAFPQFNASVDLANKEIVYKKYYSIGIAVDTDRGLLVPVIRDVNRKNLIDISVELTEIAKKARDRKLALEDMQGGNFTISNLGGLGGTAFTPVINAPEVAILGVSRGAYEQVYQGGEFVPRLMLPLSLSYDHRIIDGADGVRFLRWIIEALEHPFTLLLEG